MGNAKQAASYYVAKLGFNSCAYSGLETGNRDWATHVVSNGKIKLAFQTPYGKNEEFSRHMDEHGDGVRDVAFEVENCEQTFKVAVSKGGIAVRDPTVLEDENGKIIIATVRTYGDTRHSFVQRVDFKGAFMPKFQALENDPIVQVLGELKYNFIDHIVANHTTIEKNVEWYQNVLQFHKYWSIDDTLLHTEYRYLNDNFLLINSLKSFSVFKESFNYVYNHQLTFNILILVH